MTHNALVHDCYSYHPITNTLRRETQQNAALRRRYATVLKARDAGVIGIVVGTLGVSGYGSLITELKRRIRQAGKKPYLFAMGKLNPAKMANFQEIDLFVLVSCGEHAILMESSRAFYKPIATPYELLLALAARPQDTVLWTGRWATDFEQVMEMPEQNAEENTEEDRDPDAPHFSLLTGGYAAQAKPMKPISHATEQDSALVKTSSDTQLSLIGGVLSPAAAFLRNKKAWTGLGADHAHAERHEEDESVGRESSGLTQGRTGVARDYDL
jgi:diphthamide biosynthesis protein 2